MDGAACQRLEKFVRPNRSNCSMDLNGERDPNDYVPSAALIPSRTGVSVAPLLCIWPSSFSLLGFDRLSGPETKRIFNRGA